MSHLGSYLQRRRKALGLRREEVAFVLGISTATQKTWEDNTWRIPLLATTRLAEAYRAPIEDIVQLACEDYVDIVLRREAQERKKRELDQIKEEIARGR